MDLQDYRDKFPHKHSMSMTFPPIPGWNPDSNPWDDYLYPPSGPTELMRRKGTPIKVRLTGDSPAISGSMVSFTAKLEYPPCQKEDVNGEVVWDEHCTDGNGQLKSGYVFNWTSWTDDYDFGKCTDRKRCNVFPDGKPFPQNNDWRHKGYVYVWHTMGQYYQTCDGSSSTLTLNTSGITLGAELMEVLVYRKSERRKYSPLATDTNVFFVTDQIPVVVNMSQKRVGNLSENVFVCGTDVVFTVSVHDPSHYLKAAEAVNYKWDFRDGNQLVTQSSVATHVYNVVGDINIKLTVEAAFKIPCPSPTPKTVTQPPTAAPTSPPSTQGITRKMETTHETLPATVSDMNQGLMLNPIQLFALFLFAGPSAIDLPASPTPIARLLPRRSAKDCFRFLYGTFQTNITITEPKQLIKIQPANRIVEVSAAKVNNTDISFLVKYLGSPTSACTIVSDPACHQVRNVVCDDVSLSSGSEVHLRRTFLEPGTYCVNITLEDASSLDLATTTVTVGNTDPVPPVSKTSHATEVVLSSSAFLVAIFALIALMLYRRHKVYRRVRTSLVEDASGSGHVGVGGRMGRLKEIISPMNDERSPLLMDRRPL
ncbi:hypothetical protein DPEC_G00284850 [Dallia pectoralis]|uniref:Uncharacterized protein n=1 Tax=Dallia pectoralis TaxID=75939 RepID=A0ACC2FJP1_DALPE|nr:hypothetical protein DPEC_G00284850 [Dallia pectoralis]